MKTYPITILDNPDIIERAQTDDYMAWIVVEMEQQDRNLDEAWMEQDTDRINRCNAVRSAYERALRKYAGHWWGERR